MPHAQARARELSALCNLRAVPWLPSSRARRRQLPTIHRASCKCECPCANGCGWQMESDALWEAEEGGGDGPADLHGVPDNLLIPDHAAVTTPSGARCATIAGPIWMQWSLASRWASRWGPSVGWAAHCQRMWPLPCPMLELLSRAQPTMLRKPYAHTDPPPSLQRMATCRSLETLPTRTGPAA
jgi:hypothetical protein